jgi:DNA polymerase III delta subunit
MASFSHWRREYADKGVVKKVTWVCGDQRVLVEEVVSHTRESLAVTESDYELKVAGQDPDKEIWAAANQYPFDPTQNRLVVVRDAEKIKRWAPLETWLENTRTLPTVHLLFVSNESDFPYQLDSSGKRTPDLKQHLGWIKGRGHLVRCAYPNADDVVSWIQRRVSCDQFVAKHLLQRVGGDLGKANNVCRKAQLFSGGLRAEVVDVLCSESPSSDFVDSLVALDKPRAFRAIEALPRDEWSMAIGQLDSRLETLARLNKHLSMNKTLKDLAIAGDVPYFLAEALMPVAKNYDRPRRQRCRRVLAAVDDAYRSGAQDGVLETLVSMW